MGQGGGVYRVGTSCYYSVLITIAILFICFLIVSFHIYPGAIEFESDGGIPLTTNLTVGNGSDVLVMVTCSDSSDSLTGGTWEFSNGTRVPEPLTAFGISQDPLKGVLRIYPAPLIEDDDQQMFICRVNETSENLTFTLRELDS